MARLAQLSGRPVGLSDHTLTPWASIAAVVLGASVIERHFAFSRLAYGSDAQHSLEPAELRALVAGIRSTDLMLTSNVDKATTEPFRELKAIFEKSLVAADDIPAGVELTAEMLAAKRPGTGIPTAKLAVIVGRRTARAVARDTVIGYDDLTESTP